MGVTVPMKILITDTRLAEDPTILEQLTKLKAQGHEIVVDDRYRQYDFICGANCWYLKPEVASLFTMAVTQMRKIAHADTERVEKVKLALATKRKSKSVSKSTKKSVVLTGEVDTTGGHL